MPKRPPRSKLTVRVLPVQLNRNTRRVLTLPFNLGATEQITAMDERIQSMSDAQVTREYRKVLERFGQRHAALESDFDQHYAEAAEAAEAVSRPGRRIGKLRRRLLGAYCTMEYAIEGAALFNPSIVPHPDQHDAPPDGLRFLMSLRAVGEGHISSTVFQSGTISPNNGFVPDMPSEFSARARIHPDTSYERELVRRKLRDMGADRKATDRILDQLNEEFSLQDIQDILCKTLRMDAGDIRVSEAAQAIRMLINANYELELPPSDPIGSLILFPHSDSEERGIEDMRLVQFRENDGATRYFGTYTAYDGHHVLPMMMETENFRRIQVHTLNGKCACNKGMALFPRRIKDHYVMCSRIDGRRLFIMWSDMVHFWETATPLAEPRHPWELRLIGNCGSPIETDEGWLLFTHGVGPMRRYSMSAMLLDLDDPQKVRGRLKAPLLEPPDSEREGYTPNVVYSCGALEHNGLIYIPFAVADTATRVATVSRRELVKQLLRDGP